MNRSLLTVAALVLLSVAILWMKQHCALMAPADCRLDSRAFSAHCIP